MSAAIRCELCGVIFVPFGADADSIVRSFNTHPCMTSRRAHPSTWRPTTGGAA